jgi:predicted NAD-dependent protein-ADP-ribosyltransferase YbiA (DUF1768 family)
MSEENNGQPRRSTTAPALVVDVSTTSNDDPLKGIISETMIVTPTSASPTGSKTSDDDFLILSFREDNNEHSERIKKLTKPTFDCFLVYRTETNYGFELKFKKRYGLSDAVYTVPVHVQGMGYKTGEVEADDEDEDEDEDDKDCTEHLLDDEEKQNLLHKLILQNDDFYECIFKTFESSNKFIIEKYVEQRDELNDKDKQLHKLKKHLKKMIDFYGKQRDELDRKNKQCERAVSLLDEFEQMHVRVVFEFGDKHLQYDHLRQTLRETVDCLLMEEDRNKKMESTNQLLGEACVELFLDKER